MAPGNAAMAKGGTGANEEYDEELIEGSEALDSDGDGFITTRELCRVMTDRGEELTYEEADEAIREADADGDDQINYEENLERERAVLFSEDGQY